MTAPNNSPWETRASRVRELRNLYPSATDLLEFYERVLRFQRNVAQDFKDALDPRIALREQIDPAVASSRMPSLLALAVEHGKDALAQHARTLQTSGAASWQTLLHSALATPPELTALDDFFARATLQPIAEKLQSQIPANSNYSKPVCPACGGLPQLAVLRPEGEGASRWLLCSFCLREWLFRRIVCLWCGEEDKEKLPRYSAEECVHVHVEACDTCKRYLKAVDMTVNGNAVPLMDEAALAVLDVWASEHGYAKVVRNLIGF